MREPTDRAWVDTLLPERQNGPVAVELGVSSNMHRWAIGALPEVMWVDRSWWSVDIAASFGPLHLLLSVTPGKTWWWK